MIVCSANCNQIVGNEYADIFYGCPGRPWPTDGSSYRCAGDFVCDGDGYPIGPYAPFEFSDGSLYWCENNVLQRVFVPRRY
jgi:hypothetical protein